MCGRWRDLFHNLEALQAFTERRRRGETGVRAVQLLRGAAVWQAAERSRELMHAALRRGLKVEPGRPEDVKEPVLALLEYRDGFRAGALMLGGLVSEYLVAMKVKGKAEPDATLCYVPPKTGTTSARWFTPSATGFRLGNCSTR